MSRWRLNPVNRTEITNRIIRLQQLLQKENIDGVLLTQNVDIYYFCGTMQNSHLFIPSIGEATLYVRKSVSRAEQESSVTVKALDNMKNLPQLIDEAYGGTIVMGMEWDVLPHSNALRYAKMFPTMKIVDCSALIKDIRLIKSEYEIQCLERAAKIVDEALQEGINTIKPGITELELSVTIERKLRLLGHTGYTRMRTYNAELYLGVISAGEAAAYPTYFDGPAGGVGLTTAFPQGTGNRLIEAGDPILIDIGACIDGYIFDQTRMAVIGDLQPEFIEAYNVAINILRKVETEGKPGQSWESLYLLALDMAEHSGLSQYFMGFGAEQVKFLGHGVGLELDELPVLANGFKRPLEAGMVIAIEPKFTFPNQGVIGIENTYVVTNDGLRSLSLSSEQMYYVENK